MAASYYEFKDGKSNKFWEIEVAGKTVTVRYGKIGTEGQTNVKTFASPSEASAHASKVTAEKTKKGYKKAGPSVPGSAKVTAATKQTSAKPPSQPALNWKTVKVPAAGLKALSRKSAKSERAALRPSLMVALDNLQSGTLLIDKFANLLEVRAVLGHPNARKIAAIQLTSWSDDARAAILAQYKKRANELSELSSLSGLGLPNFILDVTHFYLVAVAENNLGFKFEWPELNGLETIAESYLLQRVLNSTTNLKLSPEVFLHDRYAGLHEFYYVPLANYGADAVTWGLAYDFEKRELFDGLICSDTELTLRCYWHEALEVLKEFMEEYAEEMEMLEDEEGGESSDEEEIFLGQWLGSRLMVGYLQKFSPPCACKDIKARERQIDKYGDDVYSAFCSGLGAQALLPKICMPGFNYHRISAILEAIVAVPLADEAGRLRDANRLEEATNPTPIERELAAILSGGKKGDGWDQALEVVRVAVEAGNPGIALHAANQLAAAGRESHGKATQLLQVLPDAVCPPFIKAICAAHAKASDVA